MNRLIAIKEKHLKVRAKSILASDVVWKLTQSDISLKPVLQKLNDVAAIMREFWKKDNYSQMVTLYQFEELSTAISEYETAIDQLLQTCNVSLDERLLENAYKLFPSSTLEEKQKLFG